MLRYRLRTLLILLALLPPLLWIGCEKYQAWKAERERREHERQIEIALEWLHQNVPPPLTVPQAEPVQ